MAIFKKLNKILFDSNGDIDIKRKANNHMYVILWGLTRLSRYPNEISLDIFEKLLDTADEEVIDNYFEKNRISAFKSLVFMKESLKIRARK